mmetsp:Transcript_1538/g.3242  ORF Transcript_1538/g.3242 Transcript_1538/m.3242 type:complete len:330 (-) Transcript_1538:301-1290(-)
MVHQEHHPQRSTVRRCHEGLRLPPWPASQRRRRHPQCPAFHPLLLPAPQGRLPGTPGSLSSKPRRGPGAHPHSALDGGRERRKSFRGTRHPALPGTTLRHGRTRRTLLGGHRRGKVATERRRPAGHRDPGRGTAAPAFFQRRTPGLGGEPPAAVPRDLLSLLRHGRGARGVAAEPSDGVCGVRTDGEGGADASKRDRRFRGGLGAKAGWNGSERQYPGKKRTATFEKSGATGQRDQHPKQRRTCGGTGQKILSPLFPSLFCQSAGGPRPRLRKTLPGRPSQTGPPPLLRIRRRRRSLLRPHGQTARLRPRLSGPQARREAAGRESQALR